MKINIFLLLTFFSPSYCIAQEGAFYIDFAYGTGNQPNQWITDVYLFSNDIEIVRPEARNQLSISLGKSFAIKSKGMFDIGVGFRREVYDTYNTFEDGASEGVAKYYTANVLTTYNQQIILSPTVNLFYGGGINFQLYNLFYKDGNFSYYDGKSTATSYVNGVITKDEETYSYLRQKAPNIITPQGKINIGFISKINDKNRLKTSITVEYDILKSSQFSYYFHKKDNINNNEWSYSRSSRALRRVYISVAVGYYISF